VPGPSLGLLRVSRFGDSAFVVGVHAANPLGLPTAAPCLRLTAWRGRASCGISKPQLQRMYGCTRPAGASRVPIQGFVRPTHAWHRAAESALRDMSSARSSASREDVWDTAEVTESEVCEHHCTTAAISRRPTQLFDCSKYGGWRHRCSHGPEKLAGCTHCSSRLVPGLGPVRLDHVR
jgi:hypothetical protein